MSTEGSPQYGWQVTVPADLTPVPQREPMLRWPDDAREFALTTLFVVLCGPIVGLIWASVGPSLPLLPVLHGSGSPYRNLVGADFHFLLLGTGAGLLCGAVAVALRRDGPGVLLGLVVGGLGAAMVADRVAYLVERSDTLATLRHFHVSVARLQGFGIDPFFKVRAIGVLVAWPMAALVVHTVALAARNRPR